MLAANWRKRAVMLGLVTVAVLGAIVYRMRGTPFQWRLFADTFQSIHWNWLAASTCLMLLTYLGRAIRWEVMLRPFGRKLKIGKMTYDTAIGFTAVVLLGRAGELVRPYLISLSTGIPFSSQVAAWLLERMLDLLVVLLLFGFALMRIHTHHLPVGPSLQWVLGMGGYLVTALGALCLIFLILFRNFAEPVQRRILSALTFLPEERLLRVEKMLTAFSQGMQATRKAGFLALLLMWTGIEWCIIIASYYTLFLAFPATTFFGITDVVIFLGFVAFGSIVQIPGIGGGIQVVSIVVLTQLYGLTFESATGLALFLWIVTFVVVVPVGLICAFHQGLNWSKLKHLPEDIPL